MAESNRRLSPYNYANNNPLRFIDPDGRRAAPVEGFESNVPLGGLMGYCAGGGSSTFGSIEEYTGTQNPFIGMMSGGGGGTFGETQAYKDLMAALRSGGTGSLVNKNGWFSWWTNIPDSYNKDGNLVKGVGEIHFQKITDWVIGLTSNVWDGKISRIPSIDDVINNKFYNLTSLGLDQAIAKTSSYISKAIETKSFVNYTVLDEFAKPAFRTNIAGSMLKTSKVVTASNVLKVAGNTLAVVGVGVGVYQVATGQITKTEFTVDTIMTGVGVFGGAPEAVISLMYFGGKALYEFQTGEKLYGTPNN